MKQIDIFYDLETTGVDERKHCIIQLSGIIEVNRKKDDEFDFCVKPHPKAIIEPEALLRNGHKLEDLDGYEPYEKVFKRLIAILTRYIDRYDKTQKAYLIGYNNRYFDDQFLRKFFELNGDPYFGSWFWADTLDSLVLASQYMKGERRASMPNFKLESVARELGIFVQPEKLHDAIYDVNLTREVYRIVTGEEPERNDYDLF